jgi:uncharacterized protein YciI
MKHFLVEATYLAPIEKLQPLVPMHRAYLQHGYDAGMVLCSGPLVPPLGGIVIARAATAQEITHFLADEPFALAQLASYEIREFQPVRWQEWAAGWFRGEAG